MEVSRGSSACGRTAPEQQSRITERGFTTFPGKLMGLLESEAYSGAIRWNDSGKAFGIVPTKFSKSILDGHFQGERVRSQSLDRREQQRNLHLSALLYIALKQGTKYESFSQNLSRWGFKRAVDASFLPGTVVYQHDMFRRGKPELLMNVTAPNKKRSADLRKQIQDEQYVQIVKVCATERTLQDHLGIAEETPYAHQGPLGTRGPVHQGSPTTSLTLDSMRSRLDQVRNMEMSFHPHGGLDLEECLRNERALNLNSRISQIKTAMDTERLKQLEELQKQLEDAVITAELQARENKLRQLRASAQGFGLSQIPDSVFVTAMFSSNIRDRMSALAPGVPVTSSMLTALSMQNQELMLNQSLRPGRFSGISDTVARFLVPEAALLGSSARAASLQATFMDYGNIDITTSSRKCLAEEKPRQNDIMRSGENAAEASGSNLNPETPVPKAIHLTSVWEDRFHQLRRFCQKSGHCFVPQHTHNENPQLARWVKRQRYQYKLMLEGKPSSITVERARALEGIGFIWDSHNAVWSKRLNELKAFRRVYGHCNVPATDSLQPKLGAWVKCQRRRYKLCKDGNGSNMTKERINALTSIGFEWQLRPCRA